MGRSFPIWVGRALAGPVLTIIPRSGLPMQRMGPAHRRKYCRSNARIFWWSTRSVSMVPRSASEEEAATSIPRLRFGLRFGILLLLFKMLTAVAARPFHSPLVSDAPFDQNSVVQMWSGNDLEAVTKSVAWLSRAGRVTCSMALPSRKITEERPARESQATLRLPLLFGASYCANKASKNGVP
jgi:hypothetical protein